MNPLQQIADNLAALNSDAPERADAVIKLTNMAKAGVGRLHYVAGYRQGAADYATYPLDEDMAAAADNAADHAGYTHPSRGVVDDALAGRLEEISDSFDGAYEGWEQDRSDLYRAAAILRQAAAMPAVPEGWVLVPKEPTPEMIATGENSIRADVDPSRKPQRPTAHRAARNAYVSMLAATPAHDQPEGEG